MKAPLPLFLKRETQTESSEGTINLAMAITQNGILNSFPTIILTLLSHH